MKTPIDIAAIYEAMRERAKTNAKFDILNHIVKRITKILVVWLRVK
jgi:hypothetical protein